MEGAGRRWTAEVSPSAVPAPADGYARRAKPGDANSTDRRRLLADRNAYISYLESQADRNDRVTQDVEAVAAGLRKLRDQIDDRFRLAGEAVQMVQAQQAQAGDMAKEGRQEVIEQLNNLEGKLLRFEHAASENRSTIEAEMSRLRNELSLAVQELGQRLDERAKALRERFDAGTSVLIREAQATCVRLADDALGAAEVAQKKVDELSRQAAQSQRRLEDIVCQTEAGLEALRADVVSVRAELAGSSAAAAAGAAEGAAAWPAAAATAAGSVQTKDPSSSASELAEAIEKRLGARLGQQVLQLSEVLRHVVQSQTALKQQFGSNTRPSAPASPSITTLAWQPTLPAELGSFSSRGQPQLLPPPPHDAQRRIAVDELYRELRQLEMSGRSK